MTAGQRRKCRTFKLKYTEGTMIMKKENPFFIKLLQHVLCQSLSVNF